MAGKGKPTTINGVSKVIIAELSGSSYGTATVIDGVAVDENGIAELEITTTQNITKLPAGMVADAGEVRTSLTGAGTLKFTNITRELQTTLLNAIKLGGGGITSGSMFGTRPVFGMTIVQEDGTWGVAECWYKVRFGEPSTSKTYASVSSDAPAATPLEIPFEAYSIMVRLSDGTVRDYYHGEFNNIDDASSWATLSSSIVYPTEYDEVD